MGCLRGGDLKRKPELSKCKKMKILKCTEEGHDMRKSLHFAVCGDTESRSVNGSALGERGSGNSVGDGGGQVCEVL